MKYSIILLLVVAVIALTRWLLLPEQVVIKDSIIKWLNITAPYGKKFCFLYTKKQKWGSKEYLARKIIRVLAEEVEVENFDESKSKIPWKGLKEFKHPYMDIKHLEINPKRVEVDINESTSFSVQAVDNNGNARTIAIEQLDWSTTGGRIDKSRAFQVIYQAKKLGLFEINVSLGSFSATAITKVRQPAQLRLLTISPQDIALEVGQSQLLELQGKDQYGQPVKILNVEWLISSDISKTGRAIPIQSSEVNTKALLFKADEPGQFVITAKSNDIESRATIVVKEAARLHNLKISPSAVNLVIGEKQNFTVEGLDQDGHWIKTEAVNWKASTGVIDSHGNFLGKVIGQAIITAQVSGIEAQACVNVTEPSHLVSLSIEPLSVEMKVGQFQKFTATGQDQYHNFVNTGSLQWQATTGQIDDNGTFKATIPGICVITVRSGSISSQVNIAVTSNPTRFLEVLVGSGIKDPITQELFQTGEIAYCCMGCELGYHEDSWEYCNRQCSRCSSDGQVKVYELPNIFIAKASEYFPLSKRDLGCLIGKSSNGSSSSLREALTNSTYSNNSEENRWCFVYFETQNMERRQVIAKRVLSVCETEIQVEDCTGSIIYLPIALLRTVAKVSARQLELLGSLVLWSLNINLEGKNKQSFELKETVEQNPQINSAFNALVTKTETINSTSDKRKFSRNLSKLNTNEASTDSKDELISEQLETQVKNKSNDLIALVHSNNHYTMVRKVAQRSRQLRNHDKELTDKQAITQAITEILGDV